MGVEWKSAQTLDMRSDVNCFISFIYSFYFSFFLLSPCAHTMSWLLSVCISMNVTFSHFCSFPNGLLLCNDVGGYIYVFFLIWFTHLLSRSLCFACWLVGLLSLFSQVFQQITSHLFWVLKLNLVLFYVMWDHSVLIEVDI